MKNIYLLLSLQKTIMVSLWDLRIARMFQKLLLNSLRNKKTQHRSNKVISFQILTMEVLINSVVYFI